MKKFKVKMQVSITEVMGNYNDPTPLSFDITENVPKDVDPLKYLPKRLAEELKRHSNGLELEWKDENSPENSIDEEFGF